MNCDLTKMSIIELQDMHKECMQAIIKMVADKETIEKCAAIEKELQQRGK